MSGLHAAGASALWCARVESQFADQGSNQTLTYKFPTQPDGQPTEQHQAMGARRREQFPRTCSVPTTGSDPVSAIGASLPTYLSVASARNWVRGIHSEAKEQSVQSNRKSAYRSEQKRGSQRSTPDAGEATKTAQSKGEPGSRGSSGRTPGRPCLHSHHGNTKHTRRSQCSWRKCRTLPSANTTQQGQQKSARLTTATECQDESDRR